MDYIAWGVLLEALRLIGPQYSECNATSGYDTLEHPTWTTRHKLRSSSPTNDQTCRVKICATCVAQHTLNHEWVSKIPLGQHAQGLWETGPLVRLLPRTFTSFSITLNAKSLSPSLSE